MPSRGGPRAHHRGVVVRAGILIGFNQLFYTAISTSWTPERGPSVTHCCKRLHVSSATFRRREHLSGYRSRQARVELPVLGWKLSEREQNRPSTGQFGAILQLIVPLFRLIAQTMRRRSTPRSCLRRRRIAEFKLAKPRIHPAELYGGNEDDSADGPVQGAIRVWKP